MKLFNVLLSFSLLALFACGGGSKTQPNAETFEEVKIEETAETIAVKNYLNTQKVEEYTLLSYGDFNKVFNAEIISAVVNHPYKDHDGVSSSTEISSAVFIRIGGELHPFDDIDQLIQSKELISAIKDGVLLKHKQDPIAICKALNVLDPSGANNNYGYLHEGNTWFFMRDKFFDEYRGYVFTTDVNGSISSIEEYNVEGIDFDKVVVPNIDFKEETGHKLSLSVPEKEQINNFITSSSKASFGVRELNVPLLDEIGAKLHEYSIIYSVDQEGLSGSFSGGGMFVLEYNGAMQHFSNSLEVLCSDIFIQAISKKIPLTSNDGAQRLQDLMDEIAPAEDESEKSFYHSNHSWHFVRGTFFDDNTGFIVKTDAEGTISRINYELKM